jgi:hypothetical protein
VDIQIQVLLTSELVGGKWLAQGSCRFSYGATPPPPRTAWTTEQCEWKSGVTIRSGSLTATARQCSTQSHCTPCDCPAVQHTESLYPLRLPGSAAHTVTVPTATARQCSTHSHCTPCNTVAIALTWSSLLCKSWGSHGGRMWRRVAIVRTDVSEELSASIIRVTRIRELGTTLAVTSNRCTLRSVGSYKSHTA